MPRFVTLESLAAGDDREVCRAYIGKNQIKATIYAATKEGCLAIITADVDAITGAPVRLRQTTTVWPSRISEHRYAFNYACDEVEAINAR